MALRVSPAGKGGSLPTTPGGTRATLAAAATAPEGASTAWAGAFVIKLAG